MRSAGDTGAYREADLPIFPGVMLTQGGSTLLRPLFLYGTIDAEPALCVKRIISHQPQGEGYGEH